MAYHDISGYMNQAETAARDWVEDGTQRGLNVVRGALGELGAGCDDIPSPAFAQRCKEAIAAADCNRLLVPAAIARCEKAISDASARAYAASGGIVGSEAKTTADTGLQKKIDAGVPRSKAAAAYTNRDLGLIYAVSGGPKLASGAGGHYVFMDSLVLWESIALMVVPGSGALFNKIWLRYKRRARPMPKGVATPGGSTRDPEAKGGWKSDRVISLKNTAPAAWIILRGPKTIQYTIKTSGPSLTKAMISPSSAGSVWAGSNIQFPPWFDAMGNDPGPGRTQADIDYYENLERLETQVGRVAINAAPGLARSSGKRGADLTTAIRSVTIAAAMRLTGGNIAEAKKIAGRPNKVDGAIWKAHQAQQTQRLQQQEQALPAEPATIPDAPEPLPEYEPDPLPEYEPLDTVPTPIALQPKSNKMTILVASGAGLVVAAGMLAYFLRKP